VVEAEHVTTVPETSSSRGSLIYDPKVRAAVYQIVLVGLIVFLIWYAASNAVENMQRLGIKTGFDFFNNHAGFDVNQKLIAFNSSVGTYGTAFWVGLLNTLLVGIVGVVLTTFVGFTVGIARLSPNWMLAKLAKAYVELLRNIPLLLQLLFWYNAVLKPLPNPRASVNFGGGFFLNNRGLFMPDPVLQAGSWAIGIALLIGLAGAFFFRAWARKQQMATGKQYPVGLITAALVFGLPILAYFASGMPIALSYPELKGFNFTGGLQVYPEFVALLLGLTMYTAAFIAEIVRAGILAVSKGQTEAAGALGLSAGQTLKLVVIPQAMRVIIPPLTSQYLNLIKNSSLAVAIGYPDLVQVFMGTVLNQTGQAMEVIAITMLVYLTISLVTSAIMNAYNRRVAIVER
jgi:general L-amino acid transport system permease protein